MSNGRDFDEILEAARAHYENLKTDITNASTRLEHIRLTALANEAHHLYKNLLNFSNGLVYSHTLRIEGVNAAPEPAATTFNESEEVLDLPEFKSPFDPRHQVQ
jgi:hypothetical protein